MNTDFDKIYLTHKESFLLFKMRFNSNTPQEALGESFETFRKYDLIRFNFQEAENAYSPKKYDGTCHSCVFNNCINKFVTRAVATGAIKLAAGSFLMLSIIILKIHILLTSLSLFAR